MRSGTILIALLVGLAAGLCKLTYSASRAQDQTEHAVLEIIESVYGAVSAYPDESRDWDQFRAAFLADHARIITLTGFERRPIPMTPEEFIDVARTDPVWSGSFKRPLSARTEIHGRLAHVWSTYEVRPAPQAEPIARGINSFTLVKDTDDCWRILILTHEDHRSMTPIADR